MKKRNTYLKQRIRVMFVIVEHSENIQIQFVYTEVYSLFFSCGLIPQGVKETGNF